MKLLYLNTLYSPHVGGGAETTLQTLVGGMRDRGHDVVVLATGPEPGLQEEVVGGVRVIRAGLRNVYWHHSEKRPAVWRRALWHSADIYNPAMGTLVEAVVRRELPDIVSCHNLAGWSVAAWPAIQRAGAPVVQVLHDLYNLCPASTMFRAGRACPRQCIRCKAFRLPHARLSRAVDAVVGVSRFVLDRHLEYGRFGRARIKRTIHNVRAIAAPAWRGPAHAEGEVRFGFIGTLVPAKGIELLLQTFSRLELANAKLIVAGAGKRDYERGLRSRYASERIRFLGYCRPEEFFPTVDVLVVPSLCCDNLPGVVIESLAYSIPVIGSRRGGIPEMVEEGRNGYLFEPERPDELAALLEWLAGDPAAIEAMRPVARESAVPYLDVGRWVESYESLYREVAACGS